MSPRKEIIGGCELWLGDCREILAVIRDVACVVTDPPYGIGYATERRRVSDAPAMLANDDVAPLETIPMMVDAVVDGGALYVCTRWDVSENWRMSLERAGATIKTPIIWDKTNHTAGDLEGDYGSQTEIVLFAHKGRHKLREGRDVNLWRIPRPMFGDHPTPKPVELMGRAIRNSTDIGQLVLDPFMGEGPTGIAATKLGRRFIGMEIDPKFFATACRRIEEATKQPDLFIERPAKPQQLDMMEPAE